MKYKLGLFIGRFQPFHRGHESIIRKMLDDCEKVLIVIGSAQEVGTRQNPFSYEYRRLMIQKVFPEYFNKIIIYGVTDRKDPSEDSSWGDYLINTIYNNTGLMPDVIYQGIEDKHDHWFDSFNIDIVNIDRTLLDVSATKIRKAIIGNNFDYYKEFMPEALHSHFKWLREELENVENN